MVAIRFIKAKPERNRKAVIVRVLAYKLYTSALSLRRGRKRISVISTTVRFRLISTAVRHRLLARTKRGRKRRQRRCSASTASHRVTLQASGSDVSANVQNQTQRRLTFPSNARVRATIEASRFRGACKLGRFFFLSGVSYLLHVECRGKIFLGFQEPRVLQQFVGCACRNPRPRLLL